MPKPRRVSLYPMTFNEVIAVLVKARLESYKQKKTLRRKSEAAEDEDSQDKRPG